MCDINTIQTYTNKWLIAIVQNIFIQIKINKREIIKWKQLARKLNFFSLLSKSDVKFVEIVEELLDDLTQKQVHWINL